MRIDLEKLEESSGRFSGTYEVGQLSLDEPALTFITATDVQGRANRKDGAVELSGELHAKLAGSCARCLKKVELAINVEFTERFVRAVDWRNEEQHELQKEDLDLAVFDGEGIELDDLVKEEILLAVPGQVLCNEDCKGLCPICGIDRNEATCTCESNVVDQRWEKLKDFRF